MDKDLIAALNRMAEAIELLARATAGEFDGDEDDPPIGMSLSDHL